MYKHSLYVRPEWSNFGPASTIRLAVHTDPLRVTVTHFEQIDHVQIYHLQIDHVQIDNLQIDRYMHIIYI